LEQGLNGLKHFFADQCVDARELNGGIRYYKHGFGCAVHLPDGGVDFDFGDKGEIDGFAASRLIGFSEGCLDQYRFSSEEELKKCSTQRLNRATCAFLVISFII
jgi:hypothetical protein